MSSRRSASTPPASPRRPGSAASTGDRPPARRSPGRTSTICGSAAPSCSATGRCISAWSIRPAWKRSASAPPVPIRPAATSCATAQARGQRPPDRDRLERGARAIPRRLRARGLAGPHRRERPGPARRGHHRRARRRRLARRDRRLPPARPAGGAAHLRARPAPPHGHAAQSRRRPRGRPDPRRRRRVVPPGCGQVLRRQWLTAGPARPSRRQAHRARHAHAPVSRRGCATSPPAAGPSRSTPTAASASRPRSRPSRGSISPPRRASSTASCMSAGQARAIAAVGAHAVVQPAFVDMFAGAAAEGFVFDDLDFAPFRSLHDAGVVLAASSDAPCTDAHPLADCAFGVTRRGRNGYDLDAEQSLDYDTWLHAATIGAARVGGQEHERGSLAAGKRADLVVLSGELDAESPPARWPRPGSRASGSSRRRRRPEARGRRRSPPDRPQRATHPPPNPTARGGNTTPGGRSPAPPPASARSRSWGRRSGSRAASAPGSSPPTAPSAPATPATPRTGSAAASRPRSPTRTRPASSTSRCSASAALALRTVDSTFARLRMMPGSCSRRSMCCAVKSATASIAKPANARR